MKKRGFTLIELLAVIVVLAIIALIATPIVMNTIKRSKKGAAESSADNYIKQVEIAVSTSKVAGNEITSGEYDIDEDGNLVIPSLPEGKLKIEMNGTKPTSGKIKITNGTVDQVSSSMTIGDYDVTYNSTKKTYEATEKGNSTTNAICELSEGIKETVGAKYTCHLDSDRTFYVLETSGDNVSLIMDRNFTDDTVAKTLAWCIDDGFDNKTCQNVTSKEEGTPLKHIQDTFGTDVEVSIPSEEQIKNAYKGSMPTWIYDYLDSTTHSVLSVMGYWTSTHVEAISSQAWAVFYDGSLDSYSIFKQSFHGLRPVITVSKTQLN